MVSPLLLCFSLRVRRNGEGRSFFLSLSLSLTTLLFSCRKERLRMCFPLYGQRRSATALPASVISLLAEWFFRVACCNAFFCSGGILVRTADCPWRRLSASEAAPFPFREIRFSILSDKVKRKDRHPVGFLKSGKYRRNFLKGALKTRGSSVEPSPRPECVAALMSWSQGDAGGGLFSPSCGTFARFLNAGGHREEGNRLAASGRGDKKGGAG